MERILQTSFSLVVLACILGACATARVPKTTYTSIENKPYTNVYIEQPDHFEQPPVFNARELFSDRMIDNRYYSIDPMVVNNGYNNLYRVTSNYGFFEAEGTRALARLLKEIRAVAMMREISSSREFKAAVGDAMHRPLRGAMKFVTTPLKTLINIPLGTVKFTRRFSTLIIENRSELEDSRSAELLGFSKAKREYAYHLGVDVYSDNRPLQEHLNHLTMVNFAAELPVNVGFALLPKPVNITLGGAVYTENLDRLMVDKSPEDLRYENRRKLSDLGLTVDPINRFLGHDWLSPRHQTAIIMALEDMRDAKGISGMVNLASSSQDARTSYFVQHMLELLAVYHSTQKTFATLHSWNDLAMGQTIDHELVLMLSTDYIAWTQRVAEAFDSISERIAKPIGLKAKNLIVTGAVSPRTKKELMAQGWTVQTLAQMGNQEVFETVLMAE